jgi:hypothetical protein
MPEHNRDYPDKAHHPGRQVSRQSFGAPLNIHAEGDYSKTKVVEEDDNPIARSEISKVDGSLQHYVEEAGMRPVKPRNPGLFGR